MRSEIRSLSSMVPRSLLIQDGFGSQVDLDIVEAKIGIPRYPLTPSIDLLLLGIQIEHVSVSDETGVHGISSERMLNLLHRQGELLDRKAGLWVVKWKGRDVRI
jgi:hypothetical protein